MENSTLLTEKPIQGRSGAAKNISFMNRLRDLKGTWYTVPDNSRGGFTRPKDKTDEFLKKDKNFIRNILTGMNQKGFRKEDIARFDKLVKTIKGTPNLSSEKTAKLLKIAGKVRGIGEEVCRRNKPSNIKKKKTLDAALEKLKKKREEVKEGSSIIYVGKKRQYHGPTGDHRRDKEGNIVASHYKKKPSPTGEKYGDKSGRPKTPKPADVRARRKKTDTTRSALNRAKKFEREKARVNQGDAKRRSSGTGEYAKGFSEDFTGVLRKDDPSRRTPGKTITTKAKTVGYERGDLPADKKKKQLPKSKSTAIVKTGDKKDDKKQKLTPNTPGKDRVAQGGPIEKSKEKEKEKGGIKDFTNKKKGVIARRKAKERLKNAAKNLAQGAADNATKVTGGVASAYGTSSFKESKKFSDLFHRI